MTTSIVRLGPGKFSGKLATIAAAGTVGATFATYLAVQMGIESPGNYVTPPTTLTIVLASGVALVTSLPLAAAGFTMGRLLRNFVRPQAVFVRGGFWDIFKEKLFWSFVPQLIGLAVGGFIGLMIGTSLYGPLRPELRQQKSGVAGAYFALAVVPSFSPAPTQSRIPTVPEARA